MSEAPDDALAEKVRTIAREYELMAYTSAGDPADRAASTRYAIRAGVLHLAADRLARAKTWPTGDSAHAMIEAGIASLGADDERSAGEVAMDCYLAMKAHDRPTDEDVERAARAHYEARATRIEPLQVEGYGETKSVLWRKRWKPFRGAGAIYE